MGIAGMKQVQERRRRIYLARHFPSAVEARIAKSYDIVRNTSGEILDAEQLAAEAKGCAYLFVSATETVSRLVFEKLAGTLEAVATLSVGYDHIDLKAAKQHGVPIFNSPGVLSEACAEIGMLLLLNASRRAYEADALVRSGNWTGWAPTQLLGIGLVGKRLGILGMGRIGREVAARARSFGLKIHYHNRRRLPGDEERDAIYHATPDALLAVSDIFMICAPRTPDLIGFLDHKRISLLPHNAIVINISRGDIVVDDALIAALEVKRIFAAGLDVYANEPLVDPRYFKLNNVFLTSHIGSATEDTRNAMGFILLDALDANERGAVAQNRVC
jgi:lactate dehydrogenase-like 2-hydroxyacid dehydrogenase